MPASKLIKTTSDMLDINLTFAIVPIPEKRTNWGEKRPTGNIMKQNYQIYHLEQHRNSRNTQVQVNQSYNRKTHNVNLAIVHNLRTHTVFLFCFSFFLFPQSRGTEKECKPYTFSLVPIPWADIEKIKEKIINLSSTWLRHFYCLLINQTSGNSKIEIMFLFLFHSFLPRQTEHEFPGIRITES